jgi:galactokinase
LNHFISKQSSNKGAISIALFKKTLFETMVKKIHSNYSEVYGNEPQLISSSPGRINLIGEHTDYNEGFVLPASIDKSVFAALGKRPDDKVCMYSVDFNEKYETDINKLFPSETVRWSDYVTGIMAMLNLPPQLNVL